MHHKKWFGINQGLNQGIVIGGTNYNDSIEYGAPNRSQCGI